MEPPAPGPPGQGAEPRRHRPLAQVPLAGGKKNAAIRKAWIVFEDESGFSQRPPIRATWAPKAHTPVIVEPFSWKTLSVLGALRTTPRGRRLRWYLRFRRGTIRVPHLVAFLRALKRLRRRPVLLVWDLLPGHRSRAVRDFLHANRDWLTVEWLPPYSPKLNPLELLWGHLDQNTLANTPVDDLTRLVRRARRGVADVQRKPSIGRGFLTHTRLFTY